MVNSAILKDLLNAYDKKQIDSVHDLDIRKAELYSRIPRLQEIEDELNSCAIQSAKAILSTQSNNILEDLQSKINSLKDERIALLEKDGKDLSYLSPKYECSKCNYTGYST